LQGPHIQISQRVEESVSAWREKLQLQKKEPWFGLAPFAAHKSKIWPLENYSIIINALLSEYNAKFFLFGGAPGEIEFFESLVRQFPDNCINVAGKLSLAEELGVIKKLDRMICVDSSNMHLAALVGTPTTSIWGGTHPYAGFGPFGDSNHFVIQVDVGELPCRPCSVYGVEQCFRGDFACLKRITPSEVLDSITV